MCISKAENISTLVKDNSYVGRGIVIGKSQDGKSAGIAYFIMGRSANSRNRVFSEKNGEVFTEPFDVSKVEDPSLIIYAAIRSYKNNLIVTNGNQTDTVYDGLKDGRSFDLSLASREFEPDAPNYTPRISGMVTFEDGDFTYKMSILKSADENGSACNRFGFNYNAINGIGHFIHTYKHDGNPIPTFEGEPERVVMPNTARELADEIWENLNKDNKISLYVRYVNLADGTTENILINKNEK